MFRKFLALGGLLLLLLSKVSTHFGVSWFNYAEQYFNFKDAEAVCEIVQFGFTTQVSATFTPVSCVEICEPITENVGSECAHCTGT